MILENISLIHTSQFILYSPLLLSSTVSQFSFNDLFLSSKNSLIINSNSFSDLLNDKILKDKTFDDEPFTAIYGVGEKKLSMIIGAIITISIIFITNFAILAFYFIIKSKINEGSNELSMSSSLFVNLNQDIKINPNSNLSI